MHTKNVDPIIRLFKIDLDQLKAFKVNFDITDYSSMLVFYLLFQALTYFIVGLLVIFDPTILVSYIYSDEVGWNFNIIDIMLKNFFIYFVISFLFPVLVFFLSLKRNNDLDRSKVLKLSFKKLFFGFFLGIVFILIPLSIPELSSGWSQGLSPDNTFSHNLLIHSEYFSSIVFNYAFFWILLGVVALGLVFLSFRMEHLYKISNLKLSPLYEQLAFEYLNQRLPSVEKLISNDLANKVDSFLYQAIKEGIEHFQSLCQLAELSILSKKEAIDFCFNLSTSLKTSVLNQIKYSLEELSDPAKIESQSNLIKGNKAPTYCSSCGSKNQAGSDFCSCCGEAIL